MGALAVLSSSQRCGVINKPEPVDKDSPCENRSAGVNISHPDINGDSCSTYLRYEPLTGRTRAVYAISAAIG